MTLPIQTITSVMKVSAHGQCNVKHTMTLLIQTITSVMKVSAHGQCNVKHTMTLLIQTITSVMKVLANIFTSITACPLLLAAIIVIMSVSTFITDVILYTIQTDISTKFCTILFSLISQNNDHEE